MKYWELINCVGGKTSTPTPTPEQSGVMKIPAPTIPQDISDNVRKIMEFMAELKDKNCEAPAGFEDTSLNDEEIANVLSMLLEFQEKYFGDVPLTEDLSRSFMWNIPKPIYNAAKKMHDIGEPDCLNPIYWFYIMCLADPEYMMAKFLVLATNAISDEEYDRLETLADMYDEDNGISCDVLSDDDNSSDNEDDSLISDDNEVSSPTTDDSSVDISSFDPDIEIESSIYNEKENDYENSDQEEDG